MLSLIGLKIIIPSTLDLGTVDFGICVFRPILPKWIKHNVQLVEFINGEM